MVIRRVRFYKIDNVELIHMVSFCISYSEEKPLGHILNCTVVLFKLEVILILTYLCSSMQVSRFET